MADPMVLYEIDEKVSIITLNRPEKLNAISPELMRQLLDAFARADAEPATSVVLLRAEGRSFCAGYDIGAPDAGRGRLARRPDQGSQTPGAAARIRDDAVEHEKAGHRLGAGPRHGRRLRIGHAVRPDDRRRQRRLCRAGSAVFERRPGDRDAGDHRL